MEFLNNFGSSVRTIVKGLPVFGQADKDLVGAWTLTSPDDIPNAANADIGAGFNFDSVLGAKADLTGDDSGSRIVYDGASETTAWHPDRIALGTNRRLTIQFEIERALIENGVDTLEGTEDTGCILFRGSSSYHGGFLTFGRGNVSGDTTYSCTSRSTTPGITSSGVFLSEYANDKDFIPFVMELTPGELNVYMDGYHMRKAIVSTLVDDILDDLYLVGRQYIQSLTPAGFPFYMRNFQVIDRPLVLEACAWDNTVFLGDSVVSQADYYTGSPRYDAGHPGDNADVGMTPLLERLMHRDGYFTTDIGNSGKASSRIDATFTAGFTLQDQVDGTNGAVDALANRPPCAVIHMGVNDARKGTVAVSILKTDMLTAIASLKAGGVTKIILVETYDAQEDTTITNSKAVVEQRTIDINTMKAEIAATDSDVYVAAIYDSYGGATQDLTLFRSDKLHPKEEGQAIIGRAVYAAMENFIAKKS